MKLKELEKINRRIIPENVGSLVDTLLAIEKERIAKETRQTHLAIADDPKCDPGTDWALELLRGLEEEITEKLTRHIQEHPAYPWFSQIKGIGKENIAKVVASIIIERAPTISSLWKYSGYDVDEKGKAPKRVKYEKLSYNNTLRTMCWRLGTSLIRARGKYADIYNKEKAKYVRRFTIDEGKKIVPADKLPKIDGKHVETDELISEGHVHNMALRKMIKLFLSHLWLEWRKAKGLPLREPYVFDKLSHTHFISPHDMIDRKPRTRSKKVS